MRGLIPADVLRSFIERIERLNEDIRALTTDRTDVFTEAKGSGFDVAVMKEIIKQRAKDPADQEEFYFLIDAYKAALAGGAKVKIEKKDKSFSEDKSSLAQRLHTAAVEAFGAENVSGSVSLQ